MSRRSASPTKSKGYDVASQRLKELDDLERATARLRAQNEAEERMIFREASPSDQYRATSSRLSPRDSPRRTSPRPTSPFLSDSRPALSPRRIDATLSTSPSRAPASLVHSPKTQRQRDRELAELNASKARIRELEMQLRRSRGYESPLLATKVRSEDAPKLSSPLPVRTVAPISEASMKEQEQAARTMQRYWRAYKARQRAKKFPNRARMFCRSWKYEVIMIFICLLEILSQSLFQFSHNKHSIRDFTYYLEWVISSFMVADVLFRIGVFQGQFFLMSWWNVYDFCLSITQFVFQFVIFKLAPIVRMNRILSTLWCRRIITKIIRLTLSLASLLTTATAIMICFSFVGRQMYKDIELEGDPTWGDRLWGDMYKSLFTLFQCLTFESWSTGVARKIMEKGDDPVYKYSWIYFVLFILFVSIMLVNVLVALIVESFTEDALEKNRKKMSTYMTSWEKGVSIKDAAKENSGIAH